ncbi:MAG: paraquat-inducible protein A [Mucilaginibacter sp.]|nr:paraquat-inducible protein A [Mucilaginibacter sp.]
MKLKIYHIILLFGLSILLAGTVLAGFRLWKLSVERNQVKEDYALSNSVTFGLFSVDQWRDRISEVLSGQVQDYHITKEQQKAMQRAVEKELHGLVAETVADINKPQKGLGAKLKKMAFNALVDSSEIQAQVRPFAKTIIAKVSSPESERRLKSIAGSKLNQLESQIYDSTRVANYTITKYMYKKYRVNDPISFNNAINNKLHAIGLETVKYTYLLPGCVLVALLLWGFTRKQLQLQTPIYVFGLLFALVLLAAGTLLPVIEVDARIESLHLLMMGEKVEFQNQVLFYQNKSIVGIISTLIDRKKPDAIIVGVLLMLFVIALPLLRLIAKAIHILSPEKISSHPVTRYLTFEMGKWDMADVMIVGMLMTYIGLNGILKSQLSGLNIHTSSLNVITSNGTSLQPGFYIFAGYVIYATLISYILKRITTDKEIRKQMDGK